MSDKALESTAGAADNGKRPATKVCRIPLRRSTDVVAYLMEREYRAIGGVRRPAA
jgi:hypothetical protein